MGTKIKQSTGKAAGVRWWPYSLAGKGGNILPEVFLDYVVFWAPEMDNRPLDRAIANGLDFLQQHQYPNGQFRAFTASDEAMLRDCTPDSSVFSTALICYALGFCPASSGAEEMIRRAVNFLTGEMKKGAVWGHYTRSHAFHQLVPPDLDDTACVSLVLERSGNTWIRPHHSEMIRANRNGKGLFYTWLTFRFRPNPNGAYWRLVLPEWLKPVRNYFFWKKMECARYDVDGAVNANVLFYLGPDKDMEAVIDFLNKIIEDHKEDDCDKWYRNPFALYYFISRNYRVGITGLEPSRQPVIDRILQTASPEGRLGTSILDTALGICTLLDLGWGGEGLESFVQFVLRAQSARGSWERRILYYGGPKKLIGWGSEELTTAFCLEALARYGSSQAS
ncbi:MAG: hypothetical protein ACXVBT_13020 [Flavisolibacter sp.]